MEDIEAAGRPHVILCALTTLCTREGQTREVPGEKTPYVVDGNESLEFYGFQTNEAPVKYLMHRAVRGLSGSVRRVIYLCSTECALEGVVVPGKVSPLSTEGYFKKVVADYL